MSSHNNHNESKTLADKILKSTQVSVAKCYQCGKCSAGCPVSSEMDYPPSMVIRMLQTRTPENEEKLLRSKTIWLCLACEMCIQRCPMEIDIPKVMDYLREKSLKENKAHEASKDIIAFHKAFLDSIEKTGRLYEVGLIADYKLRTFNLMQDVAIAPSMYMKGKLAILPDMIKDRKGVAKIFSKTIKKKEE
ncbi:MAG: 4Fe-4S dicluster domain-containing protein [Bacteroidota bacterium]|nr:4Fe-4S dicluster domain-containing protein [Bacteroidota bacterium]